MIPGFPEDQAEETFKETSGTEDKITFEDFKKVMAKQPEAKDSPS
jgi:hypothetical protein